VACCRIVLFASELHYSLYKLFIYVRVHGNILWPLSVTCINNVYTYARINFILYLIKVRISVNFHDFSFFVIVARLLISLWKVEQKFQQMALATAQSSLIRMCNRNKKRLRSFSIFLLLISLFM